MSRTTSPALTFAALAALAAFALALFSPALLDDGDTYWHIIAGEWMLNHHAILRADPFSYTVAGAPWHAQEWLAEVISALAWRAGGWIGIHLVFAIAAGATAGIVAQHVRARLDLLPAALIVILGLACTVGSLLARPHLLTLPLLALWTAGLVRAREQDRAPPFWLIAVMPLWANLHGSFAFGLALCAALGLEAVIETSDRKKAALGWGLFLAIAIGSAIFTPFWLQGLLFPLKLNGMKALAHIGEWQPADFSHLSPLAIALVAVLFVFATGKVRIPPYRMLLTLGLVWMALSHSRHQMLLGVCAPILLAPALAKTWPAKAERNSLLWPAGVAAVMLALAVIRLFVPIVRPDDQMTPAAALAKVPASLRAQPVLNDYPFGGFLIWSGVKTYIDSRADLFGDAYLAHFNALTSPDPKVLADTLAQRHITWTIFSTASPVPKLIELQPGWRRLYGDKVAIIDVRD